MARIDLSLKKRRNLQRTQLIMLIINIVALLYEIWIKTINNSIRSIRSKEREIDKNKLRVQLMNMLIRESDVKCKNELRMNRHTFNVLCEMLRDIGGLKGTRNTTLEEMVAMFLYTLSHHKKNRSIGHYFIRSGETVSRQFNICLSAVLKLHQHLLKKPTPIAEDCEDGRWKCFKNCLGALDGTYINVSVSSKERAKYRTRKGTISMNVLGACTPNMEFIYVLPGWEGSADNGRVLRNAISRPNGLKVPQGCYYLVDGEYTNCEGFLAPYRGQRYHLKEWGDQQPRSAEEYFNMKHARARNVIERCFGLLKERWAILRSPLFFPIRAQGRIVMACCLLHNLIRRFMPTEVVEDEEFLDEDEGHGDNDDEVEFITTIGSLDFWTTFRNTKAQDLFNNS